ncbi:unnamed protein product [Cylicocyclus nassatus]|uniref:DEP domain-containing protein n=1 Tax=Cylicocyclus nassatus TaxID=53992 RepID=A0AA36MDZ4_CYLNA|nr:unnamed protein product [Cylicocyclus nassatus]
MCDVKTPLDRTTPSRHSDNTLNPFPDDRKKYRATTLWNNIIRHFREEMPVKRHRRQLTYFDDSFTGKEAVDFLMELLPRLILEGRQVDRSNCTTLLQKFIDQSFIKKARAGANEKEPFRDNATLYIFAEECNLLGISRTPRLVRTSSCREESCQRARTPPPPRFDRLLESPSEFTYKKIPSPKPLHGFNRRMSSSHGNLLSLIPPSNVAFNSADSVAETIDSRKVEVNFELRPSPIKEYNTPIAMTARNRRQNKKISLTDKKRSPSVAKSPENKVTSAIPYDGDEERDGAYEWLSFMRRRRPDQTSQKSEAHRKLVGPNANTHELEPESVQLLEKRKRNSNSTQNSQITTTIYAPLQVTHRYITEVDTWSIWKDCLLARLRQILHLEELPFIRWKVVGQDVKWNCQRIGNSGVVKQRTEREDFSGYILRLMRYLEQFPFPTGSSNVIIYKDNQEVNVFKTVCSRLSRENTMLTNSEASALVHVLALQDKKETRKFPRHTSSFRSSLQIETEFTEEPPRSRVVPRYATSTLPHRASSAVSTNSSPSSYTECPDPPSARNNDCYQQRSRNVLQELRENVPNGATSRSYRPQSKSHLEGLPEDIDTIELPGLLRASELQSLSNDVCYTIRDDPIDPVDLPDFSELCADQPLCSPIYSASASSYRTANTSTFPVGLSEELSPKPSPVTLEALSLILLTLPPSRRRRLHHLIRFMNKIAANHCLQLDPQHSNRYAVLKGLSGCIVSMGLESPPLCPSQCIHLVTVLLDYEHEVFAVPASLISDVDATVRERQREKVSTTEQCLEKVPVLSQKQVQFCRPIKTDEYEDQNRHLNGNLLELLDQICADENLSVSEKRKRLKKFKKTYPKIYAQRFPSPELTEPKRKEKDSTFLSKLFGRLLPASMCKYRLLSLIL